jgi:glycosyltransferase involved in cell wall biosynthesis
MNICYVIEFRIPDTHGGSTHTREVANNLSLMSNQVFIVSSSLEQETLEMESFKVFGPIDLKSKINWPFPLRILRPVLTLIRILKIIKNHNIDIFIVRASELDIVGTLAAVLTNRPLLLEVNDPTYTIPSMNWADKIVTTSDNLLPTTDDRSKVKVVSWAANTDIFNPHVDGTLVRRKHGLTDEETIVFYSGGFYPWHGLEHLVEAAYSLNGYEQNLRFMMVGDGHMFKRIKTQVEEYGLDKRFIFTGRVDYEDMPYYIAAGDIAVAPYDPSKNSYTTKYGYFYSPIKIFEYMSAGKPVITTSIGNIREIITNGETGLLVEPSNAKDLARAIGFLAESKELREYLGSNARKEVEEYYSWARHVETLQDIMYSIETKRRCITKLYALANLLAWHSQYIRNGLANRQITQ